MFLPNHAPKLLIGLCALYASACLVRADALDNWTQSQITTHLVAHELVFANGRFIAAGESSVGSDVGHIESSEDGANWIVRAGNQPTNIVSALYGATYGNGRFVGVGFGGGIFTSTNGLDWGDQISQPIGVPVTLFGVTFGNGQFVAVGAKNLFFSQVQITTTNIFSSVDGIVWVPHRSAILAGSAKNLFSVAYGNGKYIAVGEGGTAYTSTDANTWSAATIAGSTLKRVCFGNGTFVAVDGSANVIASSSNPLAPGWVTVNSGTGVQISSISFAAGMFIGAGYDPGLGTNSFVISRFGTNWAKSSFSSAYPVAAFVFDGRKLIGAGSSHNGTAGTGAPETALSFISDPVAGLQISSGTPPQLNVSGIINRSYSIEYLNASPIDGANNWQTLTNFTLPGSPYTWTDSPATNPPQRYYRAVLLP